MNVAKIQRRAFWIASLTLTTIVAAVLCYWQGVRNGRLPSLVQPLVHRADAPISSQAEVPALPPPVLAHALEVAPSQAAPALAPTPPSKLAGQVQAPKLEPAPVPPPAPASPVEKVSGGFREADPEKPSSPAEMIPKRADRTKEPAQGRPTDPDVAHSIPAPVLSSESSAKNPEDERLAQEWVDNPDQRPAIQVHYAFDEIDRLVELGRGILVATSKASGQSRELYLQSKPGTPPLFAPYTKTIADQFCPYRLTLQASAALAEITATLPIYFHGAAFEMAFVPDRALASEIFGQVARISRTVGAETGHGSGRAVFEGKLTLAGTAPVFTLEQVRRGPNVLFRAASAATP